MLEMLCSSWLAGQCVLGKANLLRVGLRVAVCSDDAVCLTNHHVDFTLIVHVGQSCRRQPMTWPRDPLGGLPLGMLNIIVLAGYMGKPNIQHSRIVNIYYM